MRVTEEHRRQVELMLAGAWESPVFAVWPKIRTNHWPKPIPDRHFDWEAWVDGNEEFGSGYGKTESDAVAEIQTMLEEANA